MPVMKLLQAPGHHQHRQEVRTRAKRNQPESPEPMRLQALNHLGPISEIGDARKQEVAGAGEEIARHRHGEKVKGDWLSVLLTSRAA
jgi:hypothetical protein